MMMNGRKEKRYGDDKEGKGREKVILVVYEGFDRIEGKKNRFIKRYKGKCIKKKTQKPEKNKNKFTVS